MSSKKGLTRRTELRRNLWRSMRIMMKFTLSELAATSGAGYSNTCKFVSGLRRHGYLVAVFGYTGGKPGIGQQYRLVGMNGPEYPTTCSRCGQALSEPCETERETEGGSHES